jgi:hypothetical protein
MDGDIWMVTYFSIVAHGATLLFSYAYVYMIEEIFRNKTSIIILSIIWGLALGSLIRFSCSSTNPKLKCKVVEYRGPPASYTQYQWKYGTDKCYRWIPYVTRCD